MYQIGLFSKMNQVTIKTLRHYDDIGLLKPAFVDEGTGYRFYTSEQTYKLHKINALKQFGFSLEEIGQMLNGESRDHFLQRRKAELLAEIAEKTSRLTQVEYELTQENKTAAQYEVVIKMLPEVIVASKRMILKGYNDLFQVMPEMGEAMGKLGCVCAMPEYCFNIYYDGEYKEHDIDAEMCEAVTEKKEDALGITFQVVPKVETAACLFHKGRYEDFPKAYLALTLWMESNGYKPAGLPRESYIDGIWNREDHGQWLTEIQFPVTKI